MPENKKQKVAPYKPKTKEEEIFRKQMYADSLELARESRKDSFIWPNNPNISKNTYDSLYSQEQKYPYYIFSEDSYKADKKNNTLNKNFKFDDYIFDLRDTTNKSVTGKNLPEEKKSKENFDAKVESGWKTYIDKNGNTVEENKFTDQKYITDSRTGIQRSVHTIGGVKYSDIMDSPYIKPDSIVYKGSINKLIDSELNPSTIKGSSVNNEPIKWGKKTTNSYKNYTHQTEKREYYPFPKQKILNADKDAPKGEKITVNNWNKIGFQKKAELPVDTVKPVIQQPKVNSTFIPPNLIPKEKVQSYTAAKALQIQGKPSGYINQGNKTGRQEFKYGGSLNDMPFGMPLKEQNPYLVPEYNQPMVGKTILPDVNRPVLEGTNANEFKSTQGTDQGDVQIPTIVGGQYIGENGAWERYKATKGERFKNMTDPGSYSNFYNQVGNLGLMQSNPKQKFQQGGWLDNLSTNKFDMGGVLDGLDGIDKGTQVSDATATAKPVVNLNFAVTPAQKQVAAKNKRQAEIDMQVDHPEFYTNPNFLDKKAVKPYSVEDYKKGIKEPGLQTSMDPIDLVGTGVYKGVAKALGAKEVAKGYIGLIEDAVKYAEKKNAFPTVLNTAENIGYELSTTPKKISPTYQTQAKAELEKANNWSESWYNDPATKERLLKLSEESNLQRAAEINKQRAFTRNNPSNLKNYTQDELNIIFADIKPTDLSNNWDEILKNIQNKSYISTFQSKNAKLQKILKGQPRTHEGNYGLSGYMLDSDYKGVRQNLVNKYSPKIKSTGIHEGNHGLTDGNELLPISDQEDIVKIFGDNTKVPARNNKNQFNSYEEYLQDPTEVYARIMELREHFKMKPGEIIDDDTIFKIMADGEKAKTPVDASFFTLIKNPYKFKDLFNRLPVAIPTAIGVGALQQDKKQNGGWLDNLK